MNFRPEGDIAGTTGQEQFFIEKEGAVAHRQVLRLPSDTGGRRLPLLPIGIGLVVVIVIAIVGVVIAATNSGTEERPTATVFPTITFSPPQAATQDPAAVVIARSQETPTATVGPEPTPTGALRW